MMYIPLVCSVCLACFVSISARSAKEWQQIRLDDVERDLEAGDDPELLLSEDAIKIAEMERRKKAQLEPPVGAQMTGSGDFFRHSQANAGPTMIFVTLDKTTPEGKPWDKAAIELETTRWSELLRTAGIEVGTYEVGENRLLVTLQEGWRGYEVKSFLLRQDGVMEVEWDQVKYPKNPVFTPTQEAKPVQPDVAQDPRHHAKSKLPDISGDAREIETPETQVGKVVPGKAATKPPKGKTATERHIEELLKQSKGTVKVAGGDAWKPPARDEL